MVYNMSLSIQVQPIGLYNLGWKAKSNNEMHYQDNDDDLYNQRMKNLISDL